MANNQRKNNNAPSQPRPRGGFSATEFIKKQLDRNRTAETTKPVSEVVSFPITTELPVEIGREPARKPDRDMAAMMSQYLAAAEEHLNSGAVWEAVGVYRAILKSEPDNLQVRQLLIDVLIKNNANPDAIKELFALAEIYQKQNKPDTSKQTYQKILELDPSNQDALSALGLTKEKEKDVAETVIPENVPVISQPQTLPEQVSIPIAVAASEPTAVANTVIPEITEPDQESITPVSVEEQPSELISPVSIDPLPEKAVEEIIPSPTAAKDQQPVSEPVEPEPVITEPEPIPESTNGKLEYYRKKLEINPRNIDARIGYINAYLEIGLEFELVAEYLALAEAYMESGDLNAAEKTYRHILDLEPDQALAMQGLAAIAKLRNEPEASATSPTVAVPEKTPEDKLIDNYKRILQLNPLNTEIAHRLVGIFQKREQLDLAIIELLQLGDAYMQRSMYTQALNIYTEANELDPQNQDVLQKLDKAKELQQSMTAIESAIQSYKSGLDYGSQKRSK